MADQLTLGGLSGAVVGMSALGRSCADHEVEALLRGRELGDVVLGMGAADVLLHGAVPLFLLASVSPRRESWARRRRSRRKPTAATGPTPSPIALISLIYASNRR